MFARGLERWKGISGGRADSRRVPGLLGKIIAPVSPGQHVQSVWSVRPNVSVETGYRQRILEQSSAHRQAIREGPRIVVGAGVGRSGLRIEIVQVHETQALR